MNTTHSTQYLAADFAASCSSAMQQHVRDAMQPAFSRRAASTLELLEQIASASRPQQLNKLVNGFQRKIWNLSRDEQLLLRERLVGVLSGLVLQANTRALRLEAAGWLRLLVQAGYLAQPDAVFTTLVTAATHTTHHQESDQAECRAYLQMIVDCFWPFRHPYAAYSWEQLPANTSFLPLAKLFALNDEAIEDSLVTVFLQLPTCDERDLIDALLPVALRWATHPDAERRLRILPLLARMKDPATRAALKRLGCDQDQVVRTNALRAFEMTQSI